MSLLANHGSVFAEGPEEVPMQYRLCVWAGPLAPSAWTGVGWSGYPGLCVPPRCTSCIHSFHHLLTLSVTSLLAPFLPFSVIHLSRPRASASSSSSHITYYTFPFPSTVINHGEHTALESWWNKRCAAPMRSEAATTNTPHLAVNIFIRMVRLCVGKPCLH